jgi:hypothetical protein
MLVAWKRLAKKKSRDLPRGVHRGTAIKVGG